MTIKKLTNTTILSAFLFATIGCNDSSNSGTSGDSSAAGEKGKEAAPAANKRSAEMAAMPMGDKPLFITTAEADTMLLSYLNSINYQQNDSALHSLILDADSLREYLKDPKITNVKIMLAHTMQYVNDGGRNRPAGYNSGALTFIVVGFDTDGNYIYYAPNGVNMVLNHGMPCPNSCPPQGTAHADIFE